MPEQDHNAPIDSVTKADITRLETRLDQRLNEISSAIRSLVIVEERQTNQARDIKELRDTVKAMEDAQRATDRKVDAWINRGIGLWALAMVVWTVFTKFNP